MKNILFLSIAVPFLFVASVNAYIQSYTFEGHAEVYDPLDLLGPDYPSQVNFHGRFDIDLNDDESRKLIYDIINFQMDIGGIPVWGSTNLSYGHSNDPNHGKIYSSIRTDQPTEFLPEGWSWIPSEIHGELTIWPEDVSGFTSGSLSLLMFAGWDESLGEKLPPYNQYLFLETFLRGTITDLSAVPLPGTIWLFGFGVSAVAMIKRKTKN